jgi:hypothetical protein
MHYFRDVALFLIFSSKTCHIDIKTMDLKWLRRRSHSIDLTITCFSIIIIIIGLEINQDLLFGIITTTSVLIIFFFTVLLFVFACLPDINRKKQIHLFIIIFPMCFQTIIEKYLFEEKKSKIYI